MSTRSNQEGKTKSLLNLLDLESSLFSDEEEEELKVLIQKEDGEDSKFVDDVHIGSPFISGGDDHWQPLRMANPEGLLKKTKEMVLHTKETNLEGVFDTERHVDDRRMGTTDEESLQAKGRQGCYIQFLQFLFIRKPC